jgi:Domain of unknown function (DUF6852)/Domain of unknown function (DUF5606)
MNLKETLAISGHSGLFKFVSQSRNGIVVESFADKKRSFIPATTKVSSLDDIAVYTSDKEIALKDVFKSIFEKESGGKALDTKTASIDELKKYMEKILPEYDRDRVYVSDIKKMFTWYNILHENNLLTFEEEEKPEAKAEGEQKSENPEGTETKEEKTKEKAAKEKSKPKEKKFTQPGKAATSKTYGKPKSFDGK